MTGPHASASTNTRMNDVVATIEVAVFAPLRKTFHYLPPANEQNRIPRRGSLVRVPFGRGERFGIVLAPAATAPADAPRLKAINEIVEDVPPIESGNLRLAEWAAEYYQYPLGEVLATSMPGALRRRRSRPAAQIVEWTATEAGKSVLGDLASKAPRQALVLRRIAERPCTAADFSEFDFDWRRPLRELEKKTFVAHSLRQATADAPRCELQAPRLNAHQQSAVDTISRAFGAFRVFLLHGVTGSGKTEVYMAAIQRALAGNTTALMLVPEIILTEQMVLRLTERFGAAVAVLHSGLSDSERFEVWQRCRDGAVKVLMGTRSAVWAPLNRLGVIVVDEEHDASLKQQDGFRYHARDVAIVRAQQLGVPIILGSATPSLEALYNVRQKKYCRLSLPQRTGVAQPPTIDCIDVRGLHLTGGLSDALCRAIDDRLARGEQTLLFLNRRGFAPVVLCHQCGWIARCPRCDANLVWHKGRQLLVCHHCGGQTRTSAIKPCCREPDLVPIGLGTEQIEEALNTRFPGRTIARIDRDSMRRKGVMEATFKSIRAGAVDILIGTQMLAKGHDFSAVTLVGIVDADSQLFSTDFRAEEKLAQTITQVAGRAGRAEMTGAVLIQTHHPHHELLQVLISGGYERFAERALEERRHAELPPFVPMALARAEAPNAEMPLRFLRQLTNRLGQYRLPGVQIMGPVPAAMEKKAGRYRAQLMITARSRRQLAACVKSLIAASEDLPHKRSVRWSVDIDPQDTL